MASRPHAVFENSSKIVIVMEYASKGDLYDYISERQRLTEQEARHFFRQVVSAVYYCHKVGRHRVSHRLPGGRAGDRLLCARQSQLRAEEQQPGLGRDPVPDGEAQPGLGGEGNSWPLAFPGRGVDPATDLKGAAALGLAGRQCPSSLWEVLALAFLCCTVGLANPTGESPTPIPPAQREMPRAVCRG